MQTLSPKQKKFAQPMALIMSGLLMVPFLNACGGSQTYNSPPPPVDDTRGGTVAPPPPNARPQARRGISNGQKVAILVGAAALYYIYNQHKNKQQQGPQGKHYLSKNGRVYYRDAQGRAHWVTPPPEGIQVPEEEARRYQDFEGYNGRPNGLGINDVVENPSAVPAR